jgi:hypothetical protein
MEMIPRSVDYGALYESRIRRLLKKAFDRFMEQAMSRRLGGISFV